MVQIYWDSLHLIYVELVSEVDKLLAESGISMEGETDDSAHEITLDDIRDYG